MWRNQTLTQTRWKEHILPNLPYAFLFWLGDKAAECFRLSAGNDAVTKTMGMLANLGGLISHDPLPSFYMKDLFYGLAAAAAIRLAVYYRTITAKKFRNGVEYGSARWSA